MKNNVRMERMEYIITPEWLKNIGRPMGKVDEKQICAYIAEAEQLLVKPVLGAALLVRIKEYINTPDTAETEDAERYALLLDGGTYTDADEAIHSFLGLRMAISYYVYAQNIMVGDYQSTRYGMVVKNDDYSDRLSAKERSDAYNNALEVAQQYMKDCVDYCISSELIEEKGKNKWAGSVRIRKIG